MPTSQLTDPITSLLPPELITEIFQLCIPVLTQNHVYNGSNPHTTMEGPVLLCRVSRSWKDFVYSCPILWTNICVHRSSSLENVNELSAWLARSVNLPLAVCISLNLLDHIDAFTMLFNHPARIRSLKFLNPAGKDVTWDFTSSPFTRLDTFAIESLSTLVPLPNLSAMVSAIILTAPHLYSIKWDFDDDSDPLITIGSQLKELDFATFVADDRTYNVLRACPKLVKLSVRYRSHSDPTGSGDVLLADLQILHSSNFAMRGVVAPKLRRFAFKGYSDWIPDDLQSFIGHSPQLDDLDLDLILYLADDLIYMMPHLTTISQLKIAVRTPDPILLANEMFKTLTCHRDGETGSCPLPNLRHLDLHIDFLNTTPFMIGSDLSMSMLESRCRPHTLANLDGVIMSPLESFRFLGAGIITHEAKQRLQSLQAWGLSVLITTPLRST
ncbi:hypothetical protein BJ138DRAFT_864788 [Hygrophoropsis aurantiaca]|uniref:Uncharacterized protein n=1 Tax=Hygrophoropsis aurantiaca TaxID=72124 RepID=A0ACB7ZUQ8_9AGAM|nr:hypothetical protein BJ138DRAFT_864788 [Hygrophoropsis aurantiaca]